MLWSKVKKCKFQFWFGPYSWPFLAFGCCPEVFGGHKQKITASDLGLSDLWGHMWVAAEPKIAVSCRVYYYRPRFQAPPRLTFGLIDQGGRGQRPWIFGCGLQTCQAISQSPKKAMFPLSISFQKLHFLKTLHRILKDHFKINFLHCKLGFHIGAEINFLPRNSLAIDVWEKWILSKMWF